MRGIIVKPYIALCVFCLLIVALIPALPQSAVAAPVHSADGVGQTVDVPNDTTITTTAHGEGGVKVSNGATATVGDNVIIETSGSNASGLHAEGAGSIITAGEDLSIATSNAGSYGLYADDGAKITVESADISASDTAKAVYATQDSEITITSGTITAAGDAVAVDARDNSKISINGGVASTSTREALYAESSSSIDITGDVSLISHITGTNGYSAAWAYDNSSISIGGGLTASGDNVIGLYAEENSSVSVTGDVVVSSDVVSGFALTSAGVVLFEGSSSDIGGSLIVSNASLGAYVSNDSVLNIAGGISADKVGAALYLLGGSEANVSGDVRTSGMWGVFAGDSNANIGGSVIIMETGIGAIGVQAASGVNSVYRPAAVNVSGDVIVSRDRSMGAWAISPESTINIDGKVFVSGYGSVGILGDAQGAVVNVGKDVVVSGDEASGVVASQFGETNVTRDVIATGNDATGVFAEDNGKANITGSIDVTGNNSVGALSDMAGSYVGIGGDVIVTGVNGTGLYASDDGSVYMSGDRLSVNGAGGTAMRVEADGGITLDGVIAGGAATGQTLAYTESGGSIYADNGSVLYGDIINANSASSTKLAVSLDGGSSLYGTVSDASTLTGTVLTLNDAASAWYVAGNSNFYELDLDGATVDFRATPAFTTVNLQSLNGNGSLQGTGGRFIMKADIAALTADLLVVSGVGLAHGSHEISVLNAGNARTDGTEVVTLADTSPTSDVEFALTNVVEQGGWRYTLQTADSSQVAPTPSGPVYGTLWQLRGNGSSNTGDAAVNNFIGSYLMNYAETSTLIQRLGQLRETPYASGVWARIHGGKFESNARSYVRDFDMDYGGIQIGYDRKYDIGWNGDFYAGVMFGYGKGDLDYSTAGSGEVETKTAGVYATFTSPGGFYVDAVLKYVWMDNDFDTIDSAGTFVKGGKISSGGIGYSVEVGQRIGLSGQDRGGWYMEPQVQLSRTRYDGGYFNASNGLHIGTEPFTSVLGRLGLLAGYETEKTNLYAKVSKVREFDGEMSIRANGSPVTESMEGSWWVYGIGFTSRLSDRHNLYLDIERAEGGSFTQPWRVNAGWRMEF